MRNYIIVFLFILSNHTNCLEYFKNQSNLRKMVKKDKNLQEKIVSCDISSVHTTPSHLKIVGGLDVEGNTHSFFISFNDVPLGATLVIQARTAVYFHSLKCSGCNQLAESSKQ